METARKPAYKDRLGRVSVAVWANPTKNGGEFFSVSFSRSYRVADGTYRDSSSLNGDDLANVIRLAESALRFIESKRSSGDAAPSAAE